jgi:hypothetical protein
MNEPEHPTQPPCPNPDPAKPIIKHSIRKAIAFIILCACTVLILFTGPEFGFGLQVVLSCLLLFFLFWFVT